MEKSAMDMDHGKWAPAHHAMRVPARPRIAPTMAIMRQCGCAMVLMACPCHALTLYQFGDPKPEEQLYIELINRARANPPAEGLRLATTNDPAVQSSYLDYNVNLTVMQNEFNPPPPQPLIPVLPPLAPNASLMTSARHHSDWMFATATQDHYETNPSNDPFSRMQDAGYAHSSAGENIFAYAKSVWHGHAAFQVDWGYGADGMLDGRGHRQNIHSPTYREIGVGVTLGIKGQTGPQYVTQDFATTFANPTFGTGVAYYDLNQNQFYDIGEGIAGLTVNVSGADITRYCTTAMGGGWVVPVPATASTRTVSFSGLNINQSASLVVPASSNAKADLRLPYVPPIITSPTHAATDIPHHLTFNPVPGATAYRWNRWPIPQAAAAENCENIAAITASTTGTYAVLNTTVKQQGASSFHLENSTGVSQSIQLNPLYYGKSSPSLSFQSRIRYAKDTEYFKVQIQEDGSVVWQDVFNQAGTNNAGESSFNLRTADLSTVAGKAFRLRFLLSHEGSHWYTTSGDIVGWFVDAITLSDVATLEQGVTQTLTGTMGSFTPDDGSCLIALAPIISGRNFPATYQTITATQKTAATVTLANLTATYDGNPKVATATTSPANLNVALTYNGSSTAPINAGTYTILGTINDNTYQGSATASMLIAKATATLTLGSLAATYNGNPKPATATTIPLGLPVTFTYDGASTAPSSPGTYAVIATVNDTNYQGSASGTLVIAGPPVIISQPVSTTITKNTGTTLSVMASGGPLTFQWYAGTTGTLTSPVSGATTASFTTPSLSRSTNYWVRVSNPAGSVNSITSTVNTTNNAVTQSFTKWAAEIELANNKPANALSIPASDFDGDGKSNLMEYACGSSPIVADEPPARAPIPIITPTHFVLEYQRNLALTDLTYTPMACTSPNAWFALNDAGAPNGFIDAIVSTQGTQQTRRASIPRSSGTLFMRLRITRP